MKKKDWKELVKLFEEMAYHLDYCGYGDSWERECADASRLPERVSLMQDKLDHAKAIATTGDRRELGNG